MKLVRKVIIGLSMAGLFDAGYLSYYKLFSEIELLCGESAACDAVNNSPYAQIFGIPVALLGLFYYAAVLFFTLLGRKLPVFILSVAGLLFSLYLTWVEVFILHAICFWCVVSALLTFAIFVLSTPALRWSAQEKNPSLLPNNWLFFKPRNNSNL
ncbi:MAG: vitamin K epoxide reductase family protein [Candidatus Tectomicrobia bacterium]|uniref:Vitamin K epoxide reductase family protein n=1 Tax=Tectimicrobiota bacterium TaxID=2528274 RepID=A0A933LQC6_UNCTE|nr:vitamin K epoxide reductase family protein [Candidatus Tectomicrobia bacterium]